MKSKKYLSGIGLSFAIALVSYFLNLYVFKGFGMATIAIILGIILGNLYFHQPQLDAGTAWSEKRLLEYSVVLLGATVTFETIAKLGFAGVSYIVILLVSTLVFVMFLGKRLGFSTQLSKLMAAGNAICGSSAIASVTPVVKADVKEKRTAITMVNLMGTILMLLLPILSTVIFGQNDYTRGALIGGTVQSVGQVVASGAMVNTDTMTMATLFKIVRIMLLIFVVLTLGYLNSRENKEEQTQEQTEEKPKNNFLPWYVTGFLILCLGDTVFHFPKAISDMAHFLSTWCEAIALAAIGLRLNLIEFVKSGKKLLIYGFSIITFQVVVALLLIKILL
ncbi:MAG: YeiH family protein [Streptococcaceae bacterium]|nr:YeiH family protein [Streptococcaceae bacterium]MCL2858470.1 YeiH family protein [Streptococcaceae bacterium]